MARILVIEDNPTNMDLMVYLLSAFGHVLLTATDGEAGLEAVQREAPDLIICDIHLPRMDGYEIARRLKGDPDLRQIPLVAVTALAMMGDRDKVLQAGFDGYLSKPIAPETFVAQVEAYLRLHQRTGVRPVTEKSAGKSDPLPSDRSPSQDATILVVDDVYVNRELLRSILEPIGYQVSLATSVEEGLVLARQAPPDLIISDLHMPDQDGFMFIARIKSDPRLSRIPFVFISASVWGEKDRLTGLNLGAVRFLIRPIEPEELLKDVEECLQKHV